MGRSGPRLQYLAHAFKKKAVNGSLGPVFTDVYWKLQDRFGGRLQAFFAGGMPSWAVKSDEHKNLESDVWSILWENARDCTYDPSRGSITAYLFGIAANLLRQWWRNHGTWLAEASLPQETKGNAPSPDHILAASELRRDLRECLKKLAERDTDLYTAVVLIYWSVLGERDVGHLMSTAASTVHKKKSKGLEFLLRCLNQKGWTAHDVDQVVEYMKDNTDM